MDETTAYRLSLAAVIDQLGRTQCDCAAWPTVHTASTAGFQAALEYPNGPALASRRKRGKERGEEDDEWVFVYVAPRLKPGRSDPIVLLLKPHPDEEEAHPFDSGGLDRLGLSHLRAPLTFREGWREVLGLYVTALFASTDAYFVGLPPERDDPANLALRLRASGLPHDALFFTWEAKTRDELLLDSRLAYVLVTLDPDGRPRVSEDAYEALVRGQRAGELQLLDVDLMSLAEALAAAYRRLLTS